MHGTIFSFTTAKLQSVYTLEYAQGHHFAFENKNFREGYTRYTQILEEKKHSNSLGELLI